jgi:tetratricopeptide (TPR) repeat protein
MDNPEHAGTDPGETDGHHLICPGCGALIEKPKNLEGGAFHCKYCKSVVVAKEDLDRTKQNIRTLLKRARSSEKAGDYLQASQYYTKLIEIDSRNPTYWMGKARIAGYISSYHNQKINEMLKTFQFAISLAEEDHREKLRKDAGEFILQRCRGYSASLNMLKDEITDIEPHDATALNNFSFKMKEYNSYIDTIIRGLEEASRYIPYNHSIYYTIATLSDEKLTQRDVPKTRDFSEDFFVRIIISIIYLLGLMIFVSLTEHC